MRQSLEIRYNQRQAKWSLVMALLWIVLFIAASLFGSSGVTYYLAMVMGIFYFGQFVWKTKRSYLSVVDGVLVKDFGAKIPLSSVVETYRFAGEYVFKSADKKIVIDKNNVDKESMPMLEDLINEIRGVKSAT